MRPLPARLPATTLCRAFRVVPPPGAGPPTEHTGSATLGAAPADVPVPGAAAAAALAERQGGRVFLTVAGSGEGVGGGLPTLAPVWLAGDQLSAGPAYLLAPGAAVSFGAPDAPAYVVEFEVAPGGDALAGALAGALAAGASDEVRAALKDAGAL